MSERQPASQPEKKNESFPHIDAVLARYLEKIDFGKLQLAFTEEIQELGLLPDIYLQRFVSEGEKFRNIDDSLVSGSYLSGYYRNGTLSLSRETLEMVTENYRLYLAKSGNLSRFGTLEEMREDFILSTVSHENTHAVSDGKVHVTKKGFRSSAATSFDGYQINHMAVKYLFIPAGLETLFSAFNEAVTERISNEILYRYNRDAATRISNGISALSYSEETRGFNLLCNKICSECNLNPHYLWVVIKKGYFCETDLSGEKMKRLFQDIFPEAFIGELANWQRGENEDLVALVNQSTWTENDKRRIRRWVLSAYHSIPSDNS